MNRDPQAWARLGQALTRARQALGLSQAELAGRAKVSTASVQSAEYGTVPKGRMPITLTPIAKALGWPPGGVDDVLAGGDPPGGWTETSVQKQVDEERLGEILTNSMVRHISATTPEIQAATKAALDALRREGMI